MDQSLSDGVWAKVKELGEGGFGQVTLYTHKDTKENIAVKKCRKSLTLSANHKQKWQEEVDIMARLQNPYIIETRTTPEDMKPSINDPAVLVMEYCSGGDLRATLVNEPCGVSEATLRRLVKHVAGGIEYLHKMRITHRDIKPENIVIQKSATGEKTYKIIDLGYAKEKEEQSLMYSFVGTMQYLAPELLIGEGFRSTVDFWSFGIVLFECITGVRPFRLGDAPFSWHDHVRRKPDLCISIYYDMYGQLMHDQKLPKPNLLCRTSRAFFEQFLRLMLMWDPDRRGRGEPQQKSPEDRPQRDKCWSLLDNILNQALIFIFCVPTNQLLTYPIDRKHEVKNVLKALEKELLIPVNELELLKSDGTPLHKSPGIPALDLCCEDEQSNLFMFRRPKPVSEGENSLPLFPPTPDTNDEIPELVEIAKKSEGKEFFNRSYEDTQRFMAQANHFCSDKAKQYWRLFCASRAALNNLMIEWNQCFRKRSEMNIEMKELLSMISLAEAGFDTDLAEYERQQVFRCSTVVEIWRNKHQEVKNFRNIKVEEEVLDKKCKVFQTQLVNIQKDPLVQPHSKSLDTLTSLSREALTHYRSLKQMRREAANPEQFKELVKSMLKTVETSCSQKNEFTSKLHQHLKRLLDQKAQLANLLPNIDSVKQKISQAKDSIKLFQGERQRDVWRFFREMAFRGQSASSSQPSSMRQLQSLSFHQEILKENDIELREVDRRIEEAKNRTEEAASPTNGNPNMMDLDGNSQSRDSNFMDQSSG